jgi:hypothetical protein
MNSNISKVTQRGEKLDTLQDPTPNITVSSAAFRRQALAMKNTTDPWKRIASAVTSYGNAGLQGIQKVSESVYTAGASLIANPSSGSFPASVHNEVASEDMEALGVAIDQILGIGQPKMDDELDDELDEELDEDVDIGNTLQDLLSEWTTVVPTEAKDGQGEDLASARVYKISPPPIGRPALDLGDLTPLPSMGSSGPPSPGFQDIMEDTLSPHERW